MKTYTDEEIWEQRNIQRMLFPPQKMFIAKEDLLKWFSDLPDTDNLSWKYIHELLDGLK